MKAQRVFTSGRSMSAIWQEVEGGPGEVAIEVGLSVRYRITLDRADLDHLRAVIDSDDEARIQ